MRPTQDSLSSLLQEVVDITEPGSIGLRHLGLAPGTVLSGRFVVERLASSGGMGIIHRARDLETQQAVAIKVMVPHRERDAERFAQEASVLAGLSHPAIVRYLARGVTAWGTAFLAMEWLEGEDLAQRLSREPLRLDESMRLLRRACEGVAAAHARGVVHRDLKPSNLFLVDGNPARLKVLDFGIARPPRRARALTQSGVVLGTVGYMAPEQAMDARDVDMRADVFALGCILFECLTGQAAFAGRNAVAVLAKVLEQDPPRVSELRPGLGEAIDLLLESLLAKDPERRPQDAAALLRALDELEPTLNEERPVTGLHSPSVLTHTEQKIVSVILGRPSPAGAQHLDETLDGHQPSIHELTRRFGVQPLAMLGGGLLVVLSGRGAATDQARQAAGCALSLAQARPHLDFVVATGRAQTAGRIPVGAAIDRAAEMLEHVQHAVAIDELTAGLLDESFEVSRDGDRFLLAGERADLESTPRLLGRPSPFVGRDKELELLVMTLRQCIDESVARTVLVTGPPGQGKTRLRHEFVARARAGSNARILIARADPVGAGSAFLLIRQLVRHAIGLLDGSPAPDQPARLRAYVTGLCEGADAARIADFLGVLLGISSGGQPTPLLCAARNDPQIMNFWLRRSVGDWLAAECSRQPVLLVLDNLHWGDLTSVTYLGEALEALSMQPLMVLALARPEVHEVFSPLWTGTEGQEISLGRLTPRAAERLVRGALGHAVDSREVSRIVACSDGNAFYLEELIRRVAHGDSTTLPETVLALVQTRLERLVPEQRRMIRAASIFGEVFWQGGIDALLGAEPGARDLEVWLQSMVGAELLSASHDSRFPGEMQYAFRHGLLREAAYAMLTDADRTCGHGAAGGWLERAGATDALELAEHFAQAGDAARAVSWCVRAAQAAWDGGNIAAVHSLCRRGIECGARGSEHGLLKLIEAQTLAVVGDWTGVVSAGQAAMALLPRAGTSWYVALGAVLCAGSFLCDATVTASATQEYLSVPVEPERSGPYGFATHSIVLGFTIVGQAEAARSLLERVEAIGCGGVDSDPVFDVWLCNARAIWCFNTGDLGGAFSNLRRARSAAERTGADFARAVAASHFVFALSETGHMQRITEAADALHALCSPADMVWLSDWSALKCAQASVAIGRAEDAFEPLRMLLDKSDNYLVTQARATLALALLACGDAHAAERQSILAMDTAKLPWSSPVAVRSRAAIELHLGRPESALAWAEQGLETGHYACTPLNASLLRLTRSEALYRLGRTQEAHSSIRDAREHIIRVADTLEDPELRESYLTRVRVHADTLRLAQEWLGTSLDVV